MGKTKNLQAPSSTTIGGVDAGDRGGDLSRRLRSARESSGLSVEAVARAAGVEPNYLRYLENTAALPTLSCLRNLAQAVNTSVQALLGADQHGVE